jgi:hypothetical protein
LPALPKAPISRRIFDRRRGRQGHQNGRQFLFYPGMEHHVSRGTYPLDVRLATCGFKEHQQLGRAVAQVLVGQPQRLAGRLPTFSGVRRRLVGARFVFGPHRQP